MKNIFIIIFSTMNLLFNAQTVSLETMSQYSPGNYPAAEYVKDINGLLNRYVGTWKGTYEGKVYEFNLIKKENVISEFSTTKWDRLIARIKIINSNGTVEFNNFNKPDDQVNRGYNFQKDLKFYLITFSGGKLDCIDYGFIYAGIKSATPNQMTIHFLPDHDIVTQDCSHFKTTIPTGKKIYLTRQ